MKILNLVDLNKSDIKYKKIIFPDGQQQVIIDKNTLRNITDWDRKGIENGFCEETDFPNINCIQIKSRLNNFQDLELIICATKSLKKLNNRLKIYLYTPYFLGSRSDRDFTESKGGNNYLKDVICPIINSLNFESVTVLDPHSDVLEACLNNFKKESNTDLVKWALAGLYLGWRTLENNTNPPCILVSPDDGASKKIYKIAEQIGYTGDIITCSKDRDTDGNLTKTVVPYKYFLYGDKDMIIIDDVCDGGATFINIAKELKDNHTRKPFKGKLYLIVTHGIFSKGFKELSQYFDGIYCTNSYKDNIISFLEDGTDIRKFVKQLNVF